MSFSFPSLGFGDALAASTVMHSFMAPLMTALCIAASLGCTFFLVVGGIQYMSSRGRPEQLENAKRTITNALIGLTLVVAAATLTAILVHAYSTSGAGTATKLPTLESVQEPATGFFDIVIKAIIHVLQAIITSIGQPFVQSLTFFTKNTPLMGGNSAVFNMWLVMVGMADVLFVLVVALLGFQIMSFSTFGFDELGIKQLLPQLTLIFLLINTSLFAIDGVIALSNVMVHALQAAFPPLTLWDVLTNMTKQTSGMGLGALLIMIAFLVLTVLLLVYYVVRLIILYIGAALSPIILLLYLLPSFKDFAVTAAKVYVMTIFVLFVQVVIMQLASSLFLGVLEGTNSGQPNTVMALIVGLATVWALLKTPGVMKELSFAASMPKAARQMAGAFLKGADATYEMGKAAKQDTKTVYSFLKNQSSGGGNDNSHGDSNTQSGHTRHVVYDGASSLRTGETRAANDFNSSDVHPQRAQTLEGSEI